MAYTSGYSEYDGSRNISTLLRTRKPLNLIQPTPFFGTPKTFYDLYVEQVYNWLIEEWKTDLITNPEYYNFVDYFTHPLLYCYYLNDNNETTKAERKNRKVVFGKGAIFTRTNKAWKLPYNSEVKNDDFDFKVSTQGRLATSDADYLKNIIDDIVETNITSPTGAKPENYNWYLNEPTLRPMARFYPQWANLVAFKTFNASIPYVYPRTHMKNPFVYQSLLSLNLDPLFDNTINTIQPTLPALIQLKADKTQWSFYDLLKAKALKKLSTLPMSTLTLLDLDGTPFIANYVICGYSPRRQIRAHFPSNVYLFVGDDSILITNEKLIPLAKSQIKNDGNIIDLRYIEISGPKQASPSLSLWDAYFARVKHVYSSYGVNGTFTNVGYPFAEFSGDGSIFAFDELEFYNKYRNYSLTTNLQTEEQLMEFLDKSKTTFEDPPNTFDIFQPSIRQVDPAAMANYLDWYKIYYIYNNAVYAYDPAKKESDALALPGTVCGFDNTPYDIVPSTVVNRYDMSSYESFGAKEEASHDAIGTGATWFFRESGLASDDNSQFSKDLSGYQLKRITIDNVNLGAVSPSNLTPSGGGDPVLAGTIADATLSFETSQYIAGWQNKVVIEDANVGYGTEKFVVKYKVTVLVAPTVGKKYSGQPMIVVKNEKFTGIDFTRLLSTSTTYVYGYGYTVTAYENNTDGWVRVKYYTNDKFETFSCSGSLYNRTSDTMVITWKDPAVGAHDVDYERGTWDYPNTQNPVYNLLYFKMFFKYKNTTTDSFKVTRNNIITQSIYNRTFPNRTQAAYLTNRLSNYGGTTAHKENEQVFTGMGAKEPK